MGGPAQRMRNRDELTQLLRDSFPEEAKFGDLKITLSPDWLADPARLQAEGRQASTVSTATERQCRTKKPRCHKCGRNPLTDEHNADNCPRCIGTAKGTRANAYTARHAASTDTGSTPECPKMSEFRRPITQIIASRSTGVNA
ncbi:hypothetical protein RHS01_10027 [Rhizoctonia solani]|uniref:Uncharacterized protein n=1 Tax=Rhizoctonia solani TaxID=456999 RepID=A0A8H7I4R1_9AGAM|nr:hypothetical protein RHS01_10027 [Rhizoctonia solani]